MNIREGVKRIYLLFGAISLVVGAIAIAKDLPTKSSIDSKYSYSVRGEAAAQIGQKTWEIDQGQMSGKEYIDAYCNNTLRYGRGADQRTISPNMALCDMYKFDLSELPKQQFKEALFGLGYLALGFIGLFSVFLACRWIVNGFFPKKAD